MKAKSYPNYIHKAMARKQRLCRIQHKNPINALVYESYHKAESKLRTLIFKREVKKENAIINITNLGSIYTYANSKLSNHLGIGTLLDNTVGTLSNCVDKANLLNNYFCSGCTLNDGLTSDVVPLISQM